MNKRHFKNEDHTDVLKNNMKASTASWGKGHKNPPPLPHHVAVLFEKLQIFMWYILLASCREMCESMNNCEAWDFFHTDLLID